MWWRTGDLVPPSPPTTLALAARMRVPGLLGAGVDLMEQLSLVPVHRDGPASSREAAERVAPKVGTQLYQVWSAIAHAGPEGISNRQIQVAVAGHAGNSLWNKVPTRCRTLERQGLIELVTDDGEPVLRSHGGQRFMVWRIRGSRLTSSGESAAGPERGIPG